MGILFLLLAAANLANTMSAQLDFVNQAGGRNSVKVSILEKDKLMQLAQNIQRLVFADVEGQRHQESMDMAQKQYTAQTNSVLIQQQMLDQQRKATAQPFSTFAENLPRGGVAREGSLRHSAGTDRFAVCIRGNAPRLPFALGNGRGKLPQASA